MGDPHHQSALGDLPGGQVEGRHDGDRRVEVEQETGDEGEGGLAGETEKAHQRREEVAEEIDCGRPLEQVDQDIKRENKADQLPGRLQAAAQASGEPGTQGRDGRIKGRHAVHP